jgi:hypothetical protein
MDITSELSRSLNHHLSWNKARVECFAKMIVALLTVKTVNLTEWASVFLTNANPESAYMRIKRFFRHFDLDGNVLAKFIFWLFNFDKGQWYLTLDRTNWEFGKFKINFLVLAVVYKGAAIPLMWSLLDKKGNSNCAERMELVNRFIACFGNTVVAGVLADREFVSKEWFSYLLKQKIPFFIRIKWNYLISDSRGRLVNAWQLFSDLQRGEKRVLQGKRKIFGLDFNVAGLRCEDGGFLIVATTESADNAIEIYAYRWEIETLFGCLKTRGFNLEDTHLTRPDRLSKLMAVLAIAFCWAHKTGEWKNEATPIKIKNHGRKAISLFRSGLNVLRNLLCAGKPLKAEIVKTIRLLFDPPHGAKMVKWGLSL